ncbi:hypothetical protein DPV78_005099 [Talaromyces pinophilus]|nr:hypothetical protein DPV78_005099 [Talaromyces pinophilus]
MHLKAEASRVRAQRPAPQQYARQPVSAAPVEKLAMMIIFWVLDRQSVVQPALQFASRRHGGEDVQTARPPPAWSDCLSAVVGCLRSL